MAVNYKKKQCKITGSRSFNKWYAQVVILGTVTTDQLCEEIAHATTITEADARGFMAELKVVMAQHLQNSQAVKLDGLGTFKPAIKSSVVENEDDLEAQKIKRFRINFKPETTQVKTGQIGEKGHARFTTVCKLMSGASPKLLPSGKDAAAKPAEGTGE